MLFYEVSPLCCAIIKKKAEIVKLLLERKDLDVNLKYIIKMFFIRLVLVFLIQFSFNFSMIFNN